MIIKQSNLVSEFQDYKYTNFLQITRKTEELMTNIILNL